MSLNQPKINPLSLLIFLLLVANSYANGIVFNKEHTNLIFQHCSTQKLDDPNGIYTNGRKVLLQKLVSQSSQSKFSRSFVMVGDRFAASLSGLFQCRKDLDDHKCYECLKAIQGMSNGLCDQSMAARIQLSGCHVQYETDKYDNYTPDDQLNYKSCGEPQGVVSSEYFQQMRNQAFEALETGIADEGNNGFYSINHQGIYALAQCEVGIDACKCGECVVDAIQVIEEECGRSISGHVFMDLCSLSYEFNPHGMHEKSKGGSFGKLVALAVGGAAFLGIAFMLLRFCKRKADDY